MIKQITPCGLISTKIGIISCSLLLLSCGDSKGAGEHAMSPFNNRSSACQNLPSDLLYLSGLEGDAFLNQLENSKGLLKELPSDAAGLAWQCIESEQEV